MFENAFNLKFNLNKAYTDIGICDDDAARQAAIYDIDPAEIDGIMAGFYEENKTNAAKVLESYGTFAPNTQKEYRIAYLGDSITSDRNSHQNIVKCILEKYNNINIKDFAISGYKSSDIFTAFYPGIANYKPNIAVMMIGTNDMRITDDEHCYYHTAPTEYERNLDYIVESLRDLGCKVVICTLPPFDMKKITQALDGWKILYTEDGRTLYDNIIIKTAAKYSATLVDMRHVYTEYTAAELTIEDGLHLNPQGQTLLAKHVFAALAPLLENE